MWEEMFNFGLMVLLSVLFINSRWLKYNIQLTDSDSTNWDSKFELLGGQKIFSEQN